MYWLPQAKFPERTETVIFEAFKGKQGMSEDRYNTSKLLSIWAVRELASHMPPNDPVIVNCINPGLCRTSLFRHAAFPLNYIVNVALRLIGRTSEIGSRTLIAGAAADKGSHGQYIDSCQVRDPSKLVISEEGRVLQKRVYDELLQVLETIHPGIMTNVDAWAVSKAYMGPSPGLHTFVILHSHSEAKFGCGTGRKPARSVLKSQIYFSRSE